MNSIRPRLRIELQRGIALAMFLLECLAIGFISHTKTFPIVIALVAIFGAFSKFRFEITRSRVYDIVAVLGVIFTLKYMFSAENVRYSTLFPNQQIALSVSQFVLCLQATCFFGKRRDGRLPILFPGMGVNALVCASIVRIENGPERIIFQGFCICFALLAAKYCDVSRRFLDVGSRGRTGRMAASLIVFLLVGGLGWGAAAGLHRFEGQVEHYLVKLLSTRDTAHDVGFGDTASLGSVNLTKSLRSQEIALRVISDFEPGYFRGKVYDVYNQARWGVSISDGRPIAGRPIPVRGVQPADHPGNFFELQRPTDTDDGEPGSSEDVSVPTEVTESPEPERYSRFEVWSSSPLAGKLFAPMHAFCLQAPVPHITRDRYEVLRAPDLPAYAPYSVFVSQLDQTPTIEAPSQRARSLLQLPRWVFRDSQLKPIVDEICQGQTTARGKADAIQRFFHQNFRYSLRVNVPVGNEPLRWFIEQRGAAHCEFFASATVLMLRLADVPARYASGYVIHEQSRFSKNWVARQRDAHAWAEAQDESGQWFTVESTPSDGLPQPTETSLSSDLWEYATECLLQLRVSWQQFGFIGGLRKLMGYLSTPLGWVIPLLVIFVVGFRFVFRKRVAPVEQRSFDYLVHELETLRTRLDRVIERAFRERRPNETVLQFAAALTNESRHPALQAVANWYQRYVELRFGAHVSTTDAAALAHECGALLKTIRDLQQNELAHFAVSSNENAGA